MNCPLDGYTLEFISGDFATGVIAPDGGREFRYEEGWYCPRCHITFDAGDLDDSYYKSDSYFDDDSEPLLIDEAWEAQGVPVYPPFDSSRTDAELHGSPWPSSATEAASFEYEIAHWR